MPPRKSADSAHGTIRTVTPTALIVDDHAGFRAVARRMLEAGGFAVVGESSSGAAAIAAARALLPDLLLIDVGLPDMDGIEVAEELARDVGAPTIVLTSGRAPSDFGDRLRMCPASAFVPKAELSAARLRAVLGVPDR